MRTRFIIVVAALLSLSAALTLPACKFMTDPGNGVVLDGGQGGGDTTGTGDPPPPPIGFTISVYDDSMATPGRLGLLHLFVQNHDATVCTVDYEFAGPQGWAGFPATGSLTIPGKTSAVAQMPVAVPAEATPGSYIFHYEVERSDGTGLQSGDFIMFVHPG